MHDARPIAAVVATSAAYLLSLAMSSSALPERVASHFGFAGEANGWMSRGGYLVLMAALGVVIPLVMLSVSRMLRWMPAAFVNMPHRHYWLAAERREETVADLSRRLMMLAALLSMLFLCVNLLVVDANRHDPPRMSNAIWALLVVFLAMVFVWVVSLVRQYARVPEHVE